jgi:DNA-binding winged helix-turn-helix (wHTH) protein
MNEEHGAFIAYQFGPFEVSTNRHRLRKNGKKIRLTPKPMKLLRVLAEEQFKNPGRIVPNDELEKKVWGRVVVKGNLATQIHLLTQALGDSGHDFIENSPNDGYRLVVEVRAVTKEQRRIRRQGSPAESARVFPPSQTASPLANDELMKEALGGLKQMQTPSDQEVREARIGMRNAIRCLEEMEAAYSQFGQGLITQQGLQRRVMGLLLQVNGSSAAAIGRMISNGMMSPERVAAGMKLAESRIRRREPGYTPTKGIIPWIQDTKRLFRWITKLSDEEMREVWGKSYEEVMALSMKPNSRAS